MKELIKKFDVSLLQFLYSLRTEYLTDIFLFFTTLGSVLFISIFSVLLGVYLAVRKKIYELIFLGISIGGTYATVYVLKAFIGRARPVADMAYYLENSLSFPSAHAAGAFAFYGCLAILLSLSARELWQKKAIYTILSLTVFIIGLSRMYLGVHYLSDVVGGYLVGATWLLLAHYISKKITAK